MPKTKQTTPQQPSDKMMSPTDKRKSATGKLKSASDNRRSAQTEANPVPAKSSAVDPQMQAIGIGIDTARFGHHVTFLREDKQPACPPMTILESRAGYQQLQSQIQRLHQRFPNAKIYLRIDAAGQYAANLETFLRSLTEFPLSISVGEPKRNKDYHRAHSPKRKSDSTESYAMARYAVVERPASSHGTPPAFAVLRRIVSRLESQTRQSTRLINQLHETLSASFPELATMINDLAAGWVLELLEKYPTAERLAAARLASIEKIKFIPNEMPHKLHQAAKTSVGTLSGDLAQELIKELVSELRHSLAEEKRWRDLLVKAFNSLPDGPHRKIETIKGIGKQTAAAIVATAIDIKRFATDKQLTGYYGVFPMELQSGVDKFGRPIPPGKKIMCPKGNDLVRALLWQCAKCASASNGGNPAVRALFQRRLAAGDTPQVAWGYCMTKLLRQVFGVWTSDTEFDPEHESKKAQQQQQQEEQEQQQVQEQQQLQKPKQAQGYLPEAGKSLGLKEKSETLGPTGKTLEESTDNEVTRVPASLEPVSLEPTARVHCDQQAQRNQESRRPIDYRTLREQVSLQQVLERINRVSIRGAQHRGPCPIHEPAATQGNKFSANLKRQVFRCFDSGCGVQGNVLDLWCSHTKLDLYDAAIDMAKTFHLEVPYLPQTAAKTPKKYQQKKGGHHPPSP